MEAVNDAIQQLEANSARYFDNDKLPKLITMWCYGAHVLGGIGASVATLLLTATKEDFFCSVLADLAASGRPPQPEKPVPLVVAACHDFDTAGLAAPEALVLGVVQLRPDPVVEDAASAPPPSEEEGGNDEAPPADLYDEMISCLPRRRLRNKPRTELTVRLYAVCRAQLTGRHRTARTLIGVLSWHLPLTRAATSLCSRHGFLPTLHRLSGSNPILSSSSPQQ